MNTTTTRTRIASLAAALAINAALIATALNAFPSAQQAEVVATMPTTEITAIGVSAIAGERAVN